MGAKQYLICPLRPLTYPLRWLPPRVLEMARPEPLRRELAAAMNVALQRHPQRKVVTTTFGARITCDTTDLVQRHIYLFGVWEPAITRWFETQLRPGDTVVDIGANVGYYTLLAAALVGPGGRVVAIEASPTIFAVLEQNIRLKQVAAQITVCNVAAAALHGTVRIYDAPAGNLGNTSTIREYTESEGRLVDAVPASELVEDTAAVRLVKIDVEGDELSCLQGLQPLLRGMNQGASVVVEITPAFLAKRHQTVGEVYDLMALCGFRADWSLPNHYEARHYASKKGWEPKRWTGASESQVDVAFVKH